MTTTPDLILLGPAPPYRGGIADTQWQFAKELQRQKKSVLLWTFTQLYPAVLFPGKTQFSTETYESSVPVERKIHAYTEAGRSIIYLDCQIASKTDPGFASKTDPPVKATLAPVSGFV